MFLKSIAAAMALSGAVALAATPSWAGQTFDAVKAKGFVQCAVNTGLAGFSFADSQGKWTGLDVD
ncbi:MAG: amino acid ABC transporter substrate-binding protein, partial [Reyranella sp.]